VPAPVPAKVRFFKTSADLAKWFRANHQTADELWVGFYKKDSGRKSITWPEAVDEALCVGWIDGVRHRLDDESYTNRFTRRRKGSTWSSVNIARVAVLTQEKRMRPAGLAAFEQRLPHKSGIYAYEQQHRRDTLDASQVALMKKKAGAWEFFQAQPPSYRKVISWWVTSAKKEETRLSRLTRLIEACARRERLR
jgi:uncharacterized protein YdeI (YjbR/CyaY-like superfamily)